MNLVENYAELLAERNQHRLEQNPFAAKFPNNAAKMAFRNLRRRKHVVIEEGGAKHRSELARDRYKGPVDFQSLYLYFLGVYLAIDNEVIRLRRLHVDPKKPWILSARDHTRHEIR